MNLARHSITTTKPLLLFDVHFDADCEIFTATTPAGFAVYNVWPMRLLRHREFTGGTLAAVVPLHSTSMLFLLGGGRSPRYPPNKVILWDDVVGSEAAELEFRERVRGLACRRGWLAVALRRRVVVFQVGEQITRYGEWDTCENLRGLLALATGAYSTLLAMPGKQHGHVQLVHLPPCPAPPPPDPPLSSPTHRPPKAPSKHPVSIVVAHTSPLSTLTVPPSGRLLATTSKKGTLVRIWDTLTGNFVRELRRGTDQAEIYGVAFRPDEEELCVWSDKGTVHVFALTSRGSSNRQSTLAPLSSLMPLPRYFESEWSYAQYRIPAQSSHISLNAPAARLPTEDASDEERCVVGWIPARPPTDDSTLTSKASEFELVVLTYLGGWYRLSLPGATSVPASPPARSRTFSSSSSSTSRSEKSRDKESKDKSDCTLQEYRTFGRWDGWG